MEGKKRSRLLSVLLIIAMIATMMFADCGVVSAATTEDGNFAYKIESGTITITQYYGNEETVIIPETIDGIAVEEIESNAFYGKGIKKISGPSIKRIYGHAFLNCEALINVDFPKLTWIGSTSLYGGQWGGAFENCSSLTILNFPRVTSVGYYAFSGCRSLESLDLPSLKGLGDGWGSEAFATKGTNGNPENLVAIKSINIPCSSIPGESSVVYSRNAMKPIHNVANWNIIEQATCTTDGEREGICESCKESVKEIIPATGHSFTTYTYNNDAQIGVDGTETAVCDNGCGAKDTRTKKGTALGSGVFFPPPTTPAVQEPTISTGEGYTTEFSEDGKTVNITVKDGYEIEEVLVNGTSKGKVTSLSDLKTGDKVEVKVVKKKVTPTIEDVKAELANVTTENFKANSAQVKMKNGKKAIKITWKNTSGAKFDGIEIFRSTKKNSGYGKKPIFTSKSGKFYNTSIKKGKRYYYKVRGYMELDGVKYYSTWSTKAYRTVK